jgi:hypothetical protein
MSRLLPSVLLSLLLAPVTGAAQAPGPLVIGQRVRVSSRCDIVDARVVKCPDSGYLWWYTGRLEAVEGDSLRIRTAPGEPEFAIPARSITGMSVRDGTRNHVWTGAGFGVLGGVVLGAVIGSATEFCILSCSPATGLGAIIGAPAGFLLGGAIGALIRTDRWRPVSPDAQRIRVAPRLDAPGFTVSLRF